MPKYRITKLVTASTLSDAVGRELYDDNAEPRLELIEIWAEEETE